MKFISIDTETTGTEPSKDQVLEFGAVLVDTNTHPSTWKTFHRIIKHDRYSGNAYAIQLNNRLFRILSGVDKTDIKICSPYELTDNFYHFLLENGYTKNSDETITFIAAGKNVSGFDIPFLNKIYNWKSYFRIVHRVIDPGSMYIDFIKDERPPDLKLCKERAGIDTPVTHNALEDAWDVVYVVCAKMGFDFSKAITLEYLLNSYKMLGNESDLFWEYDKQHILAYHPYGDLFNKYFIQNILTGDRRYVWNENEL